MDLPHCGTLYTVWTYCGTPYSPWTFLTAEHPTHSVPAPQQNTLVTVTLLTLDLPHVLLNQQRKTLKKYCKGRGLTDIRQTYIATYRTNQPKGQFIENQISI